MGVPTATRSGSVVDVLGPRRSAPGVVCPLCNGLSEVFVACVPKANAAVLPTLEEMALFIAQGQDLHGIWGHNIAWPHENGGVLHGHLRGYGAVNQVGIMCLRPSRGLLNCCNGGFPVQFELDTTAIRYHQRVPINSPHHFPVPECEIPSPHNCPN